MKVVILVTLALLTACANKKIVAEPVVQPEVAAPSKVIVKTKYVYLKSPESTMSAMTMPPLETASEAPRSLTSDILKLFWPLLTLLAVGAVMILGLFIEWKVIDRQLARRRALKANS